MPVVQQPLSIRQRLEKARLKSLTAYERRARLEGYSSIAGVDEAGRGPLAGPVVAAACIIPEGVYLEGIDDSKKLSSGQREKLHKKILENEDIVHAVELVDALIIDQVNILQATLRAMAGAVLKLKKRSDYVLVDGNQVPPLDVPAEAIVDGDCLSQSIMAAAILAKCTRDSLMVEYHEKWPEYGFRQHKGYGTEKHLEALKKHGPCPIHRKTFHPVAEKR
jgi:ribonuclease HII